MKEYEVFQNFGALFIFYLVLAAAVGFKTFEKSSKTSRLIWVTLLFLPMANYTYLLFVDGDRRSLFTHLPLIAYFGYIFCLLGAALILVSAKSGKKLKSITLLKAATVVVVLAELVMVDLSYFEDRVGSHLAYKGILKSEGILYRKQEVSFLNYRDPVIGPSNLFSPGVFQARKTALPDGNYFYFTSDYYDYLLNISSAKQPATSSILYPILRFIPMDKVVFLRDKYAVVNAINQTSVGDLGKYIFIEGGTEVEKINSLLENRLNRDNNELELLENSQLPTHRVARIDVVEYGPNQLIVDVIALEDGYLFFGDGFHKHWKSFVDGENQTIHKTNVNFKSVFVPEGKHNVRFQFDPKAFKYAAVVSTFTQFTSILFILVTSWVLRGSRRRVGRRN